MDLNFLLESGAFEAGGPLSAEGVFGELREEAASREAAQQAPDEGSAFGVDVVDVEVQGSALLLSLPRRRSAGSRGGVGPLLVGNAAAGDEGNRVRGNSAAAVSSRGGSTPRGRSKRGRSRTPPPPAASSALMALQRAGQWEAEGFLVPAEVVPLRSPLEGTDLLADLGSYELRFAAVEEQEQSTHVLIEAAPGTTRGKKRPLPGVNEDEEKAMYLPEGTSDTKEKNRLAAKRFRYRRETYSAELEAKIAMIQEEGEFFRRLNEALEERNAAIRRECAADLAGSAVLAGAEQCLGAESRL